MTSNAGKRLEKLEKLLDTIATKNKRHHFVVVDADGDADKHVALLAESGIIKDGDDVQVIPVAWRVHELRGQAYIPEGSTDDPLADPRTRPGAAEREGRDGGRGDNASSPRLDPPPDQVQRWRDHERRLEMDGTRYQGEKRGI
jgi:hypothetical protein